MNWKFIPAMCSAGGILVVF
jgi:hypothetical protein